ncbi:MULTISPECIES: nucleotidyl transferase AbiEii/AbiGii toxin family protein [unclassified Streptomyces]|uniref:nucleotidyl transferase AbiEii/AbiGii toxin family protein n=1 Tax=unclassified Streptomyces TaxID=2593676 RepID=UPI0036E2ABBD
MRITDLHRRLLADVLAIGTPYPLVITGGYAAQAHGLVSRLSQDIAVATESPAPMSAIADDLVRGLAELGWQVSIISVDYLAARLMATSTDTGEQCEVDVLKENLWARPALTPYGPVLALEDVIGTKVRALADRAAPRDFIDVRAAARDHAIADLEMLGERHGRGEFRLDDLRDRLGSAQWIDDAEFEAYGLSQDQIAELRQWAQEWVSDLEQRLNTGMDDDW